MTELSVAGVGVRRMCETFGLGEPVGTAELIRRRGQVEAWRIPTGQGADGAGDVLVKRFWADDQLSWRAQLELAMDLEQRAVDAGIATPAPIEPVRPAFGSVARIDGHGLFRAFPYLDHRALADDDDVAEWIGTTLALTHGLHPLDCTPAPNWWYCQFPPVTEEQWLDWLREGETTGAEWAPALRTQLDLVLEQSRRVVATFAASPPYVISHRDVESWNVLMSEAGPVLIDWDTSGPESVPLEAAYVFIAFARRGRDEPDPDLVRRSYRAYLDAGGTALSAQNGLLDRLIGTHLSKIAGALGHFFDYSEDGRKLRERIDRLPVVVQNARAWEHLLG